MRSRNTISFEEFSQRVRTVRIGKRLCTHDAVQWTGLATLLVGELLLARYLEFRLMPTASAFAMAVMPLCLIGGSKIYRSRCCEIESTLYYSALLVAYASVAGCLSYLLAALDLPLVDDRLSALDLALGFDWVHWFNLVTALRPIEIALQILYGTSIIQIVAVLLWVGFTGRSDRLRELVGLLIWTSFVIIVLSGLFPAESAWNHYGLGIERAYHFEHFSSLRAGTLRELPTQGMTGIVTFPSFHTAVSIVVVWVMRGLRGFWPLFVLNIGVLLSLPTAGGHYLTDMIAAALITAVFIVLRSSCRRTWPTTRNGAVASRNSGT